LDYREKQELPMIPTLEEALARIAQLEAELEEADAYLRDVQAAHREDYYRMEREIRSLENDLDEARYRERMEG
jgi:hypothetical protein